MSISDTFRQIESDHSAFLHTVATQFAQHVSDDLRVRSDGVDAPVGSEPSEDMAPIRTVKQRPPEKASDDQLKTLEEAQEYVLNTLRNDGGIEWRLKEIGLS